MKSLIVLSLLTSPAFAGTIEKTIYECSIKDAHDAQVKMVLVEDDDPYSDEYTFYVRWTKNGPWERQFSTLENLVFLDQENGGSVEYYHVQYPLPKPTGTVRIDVDYNLKAVGSGVYFTDFRGSDYTIFELENCKGQGQ